MIRRFLLASALLVTGTVIAAPSAFAETQVVNFSGTIPQTCVFGTTNAGTLKGTGANSTTLSTANSGGAAGTSNVTCNYAANLIVGAPVQTSGTTLTGATLSSSVSATGTTLGTANTTNGGSAIPLITGEIESLNIGMSADYGTTIIPAGAYGYTVTLTVAP